MKLNYPWWFDRTITYLPIVAGKNNSSLPIVVEPIKAQNIIRLPIVVEYIKLKHKIIFDYPL